MERLASLGYVGGSISGTHAGAAHPREKIHLEAVAFEGRERMSAQDYAGALRAAEAVLAEDPGNRYALHMALSASGQLRRFDQARRFAAELTKRYPEYVPGQVAEGELFVRDKDFTKAAEIFRRGLEASPKAPALTYRLALALLSSGRTADASAVVEQAIADKSEEASFLVVRALCRARSGDPEGARQALEEAIAKGYRARDVLETEPLLEPLRKVPGFDDLVKTIPSEAPPDAKAPRA
jgi:predicted Zn-dependent protease